jgi:hypothetical protein
MLWLSVEEFIENLIAKTVSIIDPVRTENISNEKANLSCRLCPSGPKLLHLLHIQTLKSRHVIRYTSFMEELSILGMIHSRAFVRSGSRIFGENQGMGSSVINPGCSNVERCAEQNIFNREYR